MNEDSEYREKPTVVTTIMGTNFPMFLANTVSEDIVGYHKQDMAGNFFEFQDGKHYYYQNAPE